MKKIVSYKCEICNRKYETEMEAIECENKGETNVSKYPIGLMYAHEHNGYVGIFAIAEVRPAESHYVNLASWAIRTKGYPKYSLGKEMCGGSDNFLSTDDNGFKTWIKYHNIPDKYIDNSEFKEMVEYLKENGVTPQYYNSKNQLIILK